ncbi:polysaccharide pyruvyl transferase family protein [Arthrobacter sp.]|uniref:polysaccharide pyruvyl transferase family protein n=1 Tax=Arthrobacter sp. TaxID=1667 RepID=UPI003A8CAB7C
MRILVLWAHESSANLGVAALARGSGDLLKRVWPNAEVEFVNYGARPESVPWGRPRSLIRERILPRFGMQSYFKQFDLVWDTRSGDSFSDIYGFDRHLTMGLVYEFAVQAGAIGVMAPQTVGPFNSRRATWIARRNLNRSAAVFSRDPASYTRAERLGRTPDALSSDMVFGIDNITVPTTRDVLLNVSGLLWNANPHVNSTRYQESMLRSAEMLHAQGRNVALLAHVLDSPNPDNDVPAITELADQLSFDPELIVPTSLDSVREAIASSKLVIAARMHASLNALSLGIPAIPLAYSRKFSPLMKSLGWRHAIDLRTSQHVADEIRNLSGNDQLIGEAKLAQQAGRNSLSAVAEKLDKIL